MEFHPVTFMGVARISRWGMSPSSLHSSALPALLHKLFCIHYLHLIDELTVVICKIIPSPPAPESSTLHLVEVGAVPTKKKKTYRSQIPVTFGIPGHVTTNHLPGTHFRPPKTYLLSTISCSSTSGNAFYASSDISGQTIFQLTITVISYT